MLAKGTSKTFLGDISVSKGIMRKPIKGRLDKEQHAG